MDIDSIYKLYRKLGLSKRSNRARVEIEDDKGLIIGPAVTMGKNYDGDTKEGVKVIYHIRKKDEEDTCTIISQVIPFGNIGSINKSCDTSRIKINESLEEGLSSAKIIDKENPLHRIYERNLAGLDYVK